MSEKQGNGICLFCYNNEELDYAKFAILASQYAKKQLDMPVTLITDDGTLEWMKQSNDKSLVESSFDNVIIDGRLGSYKYWDMHHCIAKALSVFESKFKH